MKPLSGKQKIHSLYHIDNKDIIERIDTVSKIMDKGNRFFNISGRYVTFTISQDFYYEINGQKTAVPMARPWNYSGRGTDHVLNADVILTAASVTTPSLVA